VRVPECEYGDACPVLDDTCDCDRGIQVHISNFHHDAGASEGPAYCFCACAPCAAGDHGSCTGLNPRGAATSG